jgi:hypothetical protein
MKNPLNPLFHAENEAAPEKKTLTTKTITTPTCSAMLPLPPPLCSCGHPPTEPAAVASRYQRLRQVRSGTRPARRSRFRFPLSPRECRRRRSHNCINLTTEQTQATDTTYATRYVHPLLNCLPSSPFHLREISCHSFFDLSSPLQGSDAYQDFGTVICISI